CVHSGLRAVVDRIWFGRGRAAHSGDSRDRWYVDRDADCDLPYPRDVLCSREAVRGNEEARARNCAGRTRAGNRRLIVEEEEEEISNEKTIDDNGCDCKSALWLRRWPQVPQADGAAANGLSWSC